MHKINRELFEEFEYGNEVIKILEKMQKSDEPYMFTSELWSFMHACKSNKVFARVFPYFADIFIKIKDLHFLTYFIDMKFYLKCFDMNILSDKEIKDCLYAIYNVKKFLPLPNESVKEQWFDNFKTDYLWLCGMLYSFSDDTQVFINNRLFSEAFHVKCLHCGNDLHSYFIDTKNLNSNQKIQAIDLYNVNYNPLLCDDISAWLFLYTSRIEEKTLTALLPYLYGEYTCTKCNNKNQLIEACKNYLQNENIKPHIPTQKYINRIEEIALNLYDEEEWYAKKWFIATYAVNLYRTLYGKNNLQSHILMLKVAVSVYTFWGSNFTHSVAEQALLSMKEYITQENQDNILLAELNHWIAYTFSFGNATFKDLEKSLIYYKKAIELFEENYGDKHSKTLRSQRAYTSVLADLSKSENTEKYEELKKGENKIINQELALEGMLEVLNKMKFSPDTTGEEIADYENLLSEKYEDRGNYKEAIRLKEKFINFISEEYAKDTTIIADYKRELAELYEKAENNEQSAKLYKEALSINIRELGALYTLPPIFRNPLHKILKFFKMTKDDKELANNMRSVSESYSDMGNILYREKNYAKALKLYLKSLELWECCSYNGSVECADMRVKIGKTYEKIGRVEKALLIFFDALDIYHHCIKKSPFPDEVEESKINISKLLKYMENFINTTPAIEKAPYHPLYEGYLKFKG